MKNGRRNKQRSGPGKKTAATIGVFLGRFQVPVIHPGHKALIEKIRGSHEKVAIVIAETPIYLNRKNPLSGEIRVALFKAAYNDPNITICTLKNNPVSNRMWSKEFDKLLEREFPGMPCVIYGGRDNSLHCYSGKHATKTLNVDIPISATELRQKIAGAIPKRVKALENFAAGIVYATQHLYPTCYSAIDLAIFRPASKSPNGIDEILLCRKKTDPKGKWRFMGGFADPTDLYLVDAVIREAREELGDKLKFKNLRYLGDVLVDDWRYRGTEHAIRSSFHMATYTSGEAVAADDIESCRWFAVDRVRPSIIKAHRPLAEMLLGHLRKKVGESKKRGTRRI